MHDQLAGSPDLFTTSFVRESFNALDTRPWWFLPSINALLCQHRVARLLPQNLVFHQSWEQAISLALLSPLKGSPLNHPPQKQEWPCHHTSAISIKFITPTAFFSWPHPSVWWWLGWSKLNPPRRLASTIRLVRDPPKHHEKCGHEKRQMKKME